MESKKGVELKEGQEKAGSRWRQSTNVVFRILCTLPYILEDLAEFEEPFFCSHQDVQ